MASQWNSRLTKLASYFKSYCPLLSLPLADHKKNGNCKQLKYGDREFGLQRVIFCVALFNKMFLHILLFSDISVFKNPYISQIF